MKKSRMASLWAAATIVAAGVALPATVAQAAQNDCPSGRFCAWDGANYTTMLLNTAYTGTAKIEIGDDIVSSGYNRRTSGSLYCGYSVGLFGVDNYIYGWPFATAASLSGSSNNAIDHFYYRANC